MHAEAEVLAAAERQDRSIGRFQMNSSGSAYSRSSRAAEPSSVMIRCPGLMVVSWIVNGVRRVRANH